MYEHNDFFLSFFDGGESAMSSVAMKYGHGN